MEEEKLSHHILWKPTDVTKKLLELINEFSETAGYKSHKKSVVFPYTKNKLLQREIKEKNPIYNCIKKNKIFRNKLKQEVLRPVYWKL